LAAPWHAATWNLRDRGTLLAFAAVSIAYLALRLVALLRARFVEDHDSMLYLFQIDQVNAKGLGVVWDFGVDANPFFSVASAPLSALLGSAEVGARMTSLAFSLLLLIALFDIGRRIGTPVAAALGLLFVAFNPTLINLSHAVLTEPTFIAIFYVAVWIFWIQYGDPRPGLAALLGLVAALAFITRLEGILYLAFFPALQCLHYFFFRNGRYDTRRLIRWNAAFVLGFAVLAVTEVGRVSQQVGRLALNGRQAWVALLNNGQGGYEESIYGLDYDPGTINIDHVLGNPQAMSSVESAIDPGTMLRRVVFNFDELVSVRLSELIGALALALFGLGLLELWLGGRRFEALSVLAMIGVGVAGPLAHTVSPRHVAIVVPIMLLTGGLGAVLLIRSVLPRAGHAQARYALTGLVALAVLVGWAYPLSVTIRGLDRPNLGYDPADFTGPAEIVRSLRSEPDRPPVIVARHAYFPYYAGAGLGLPLPHTDYEGLVEYSRINGAEFLYLVHDRPVPDPDERLFMAEFAGEQAPPEFELLYRGTSGLGQKVELYRFLDDEGS